MQTDQEYQSTLDRVKYAMNYPIDNRNDHRYNDRIVQLEKYRNVNVPNSHRSK